MRELLPSRNRYPKIRDQEMHISLQAIDLTNWLEKKGLIVSNSFWQVLKIGCEKSPLFEYEFVLNDVPWIGAVTISASFISTHKIDELGWPVVSTVNRGQIWAAEISMTAVIANRNSARGRSKLMIPYLTKPEYGVSIEYPTLNELDNVWNMLIKTAPKMGRSMEKFASELESEINTFAGKTSFYHMTG